MACTAHSKFNSGKMLHVSCPPTLFFGFVLLFEGRSVKSGPWELQPKSSLSDQKPGCGSDGTLVSLSLVGSLKAQSSTVCASRALLRIFKQEENHPLKVWRQLVLKLRFKTGSMNFKWFKF